jgi:hypothetical protein
MKKVDLAHTLESNLLENVSLSHEKSGPGSYSGK